MASAEDVRLIRAMSDLSDVADAVAVMAGGTVDAGDIVEDTDRDESDSEAP